MTQTHAPHAPPAATPRRRTWMIRAALVIVALLALLFGWWGWQTQRTVTVPRHVFTGHTDVVASVAFSPDGQYALSGGNDATLRLWDVTTGDSVRTFTGPHGVGQ